jgi:protocatechuate 3,4-dioxygenase, alpha subunit
MESIFQSMAAYSVRFNRLNNLISMKKLLQTPSQTVGPYFAYSLTPEQYGYDLTQICDGNIVDENADGAYIQIIGKVLDGKNQPINDAMIEFWQSDIQKIGRFGTGTDPQNRFIFKTVKPKSVEGQAPHLNVIVLMRGLLVHAYTRLYFSDEAAANATDTVLNSVPADRRNTLIAQLENRNGQKVYAFNIRMQGADETAFFDV